MKNWKKRMAAILSAGTLAMTGTVSALSGWSASADATFSYGDALKMSLYFYDANHYQGGLSNALAELGKIEVNGKTNTLNSIFGPDPLNLFGVVILTSLGTWGLPQMVHKFYAIKSEKEIGKGAVISTFFALIVAGGSYLLGGFDRLFCTLDGSDSGKAAIATLSNGKPEYDAMIPATLQAALPDLLIGLVVVLVLSASMSTLSSLVLTSSSTLTIDFLKDNFIKKR